MYFFVAFCLNQQALSSYEVSKGVASPHEWDASPTQLTPGSLVNSLGSLPVFYFMFLVERGITRLA